MRDHPAAVSIRHDSVDGCALSLALDAGNNTSMEPYRALISDKLPKLQLARGFLTQSLFTGAGVLANLSLFIFQKVLGGTAGNGVPYWVFTCFALGACILQC